MRAMIISLFLVASCAAPPESPQMEMGVPVNLLDEMRRLASFDCPVPPGMYVSDMLWWVGAYATVVAVDQQMLAIRIDNPADWPTDRQILLLPVAGRGSQGGIKGNAVVVGQSGELLICRFFQGSADAQERPAVGDRAWVHHPTSRAMQTAWRARRT